MSDKRTLSVAQLRRAAKVGDAASSALQSVMKPARNLGFPYRRPARPRNVEMPAEKSTLGADFPTAWARRTPAKAPGACW